MIPALALLAAAATSSQVDIETSLRNAKGVVRLCMTRRAEAFPASCEQDPAAIKRTVPASLQVTIVLRDVPPGNYAVALFHDENGNGRLDKFGPLPIEGFGFSGNPRLRFGPPSFAQARITLASGENRQLIRLHYIL